VEAASAGAGKGSTFTIRLPGEAVHDAAVPETAAPLERRAPGPRGRILVVDDNRDAASSLAMMLRSSGHTVLAAHSGEQGLEIAEREKPDAIVLDIGMPQMNGYEVARRLRKTSDGKTMLLVALTGWGQKEDIERSLNAGFDFHMTKPADPERIERLLDNFLQARSVARTKQETRHQFSA
jgi:CheY-like chemotaxis protein